MYETLDVLKHLPANICSEELLIPEVLRLNITEDDMEREHRFEFNFPFEIKFSFSKNVCDYDFEIPLYKQSQGS